MLDLHIKRRVLDSRSGAERDRRLYTRAQLDKFFKNFRDRFGPEELKRFEGPVLLERMHGRGDNDSLVYWLEYKNDPDEFPGTELGGIGGGAAFKFGIFFRRDADAWIASGRRPRGHEISVDEAVVIATRQRDQFIAGCELLEQLPVDADDLAYREFQGQLHEVAPDVADSAWGHKYFYLLFPDKLDDFHSPVWQRFYLLKSLQLPPAEDGRYVCAGRYVAMTKELELPMHNLTYCLRDALGSLHDYWRVKVGEATGGAAGWELMQANTCLAIGWPDLEDLSGLGSGSTAKQELRQRMAERYPRAAQQVDRDTEKVFRFVCRIATGDLVLVWDGSQVLGIGRIADDYCYAPASDLRHRRPVEWLSLNPWSLSEADAPQTTFHRIRKPIVILDAERQLAVQSSPPSSPFPRGLTGIAGRIQSVLERKSQVILYGPPGTGKTYWAESAARELASRSAFGKPYDALSPAEIREVDGTNEQPGLVRWCCFHAGYGYEDFIEGYRPDITGGQMTFRLSPGIFKQLCKDAAEAPPNQRFYLIVDEINRGDIPRIFGELLTVLETDKRGKAVVLPLSGERFSVPPNVLVIGTMNTADRSISLLDAALRRRFGFVKVSPDVSLLQDINIESIPLGPWLGALNRRICDRLGRDAQNLQIGHAYFMPAGKVLSDFKRFRQVLRDDIVPLLEEYCYDRPDMLQHILGKPFWDDKASCLAYRLFDAGEEDALLTALREPCPELDAIAAPRTVETRTEEEEDESREQ